MRVSRSPLLALAALVCLAACVSGLPLDPVTGAPMVLRGHSASQAAATQTIVDARVRRAAQELDVAIRTDTMARAAIASSPALAAVAALGAEATAAQQQTAMQRAQPINPATGAPYQLDAQGFPLMAFPRDQVTNAVVSAMASEVQAGTSTVPAGAAVAPALDKLSVTEEALVASLTNKLPAATVQGVSLLEVATTWRRSSTAHADAVVAELEEEMLVELDQQSLAETAAETELLAEFDEEALIESQAAAAVDAQAEALDALEMAALGDDATAPTNTIKLVKPIIDATVVGLPEVKELPRTKLPCPKAAAEAQKEYVIAAIRVPAPAVPCPKAVAAAAAAAAKPLYTQPQISLLETHVHEEEDLTGLSPEDVKVALADGAAEKQEAVEWAKDAIQEQSDAKAAVADGEPAPKSTLHHPDSPEAKKEFAAEIAQLTQAAAKADAKVAQAGESFDAKEEKNEALAWAADILEEAADYKEAAVDGDKSMPPRAFHPDSPEAKKIAKAYFAHLEAGIMQQVEAAEMQADSAATSAQVKQDAAAAADAQTPAQAAAAALPEAIARVEAFERANGFPRMILPTIIGGASVPTTPAAAVLFAPSATRPEYTLFTVERDDDPEADRRPTVEHIQHIKQTTSTFEQEGTTPTTITSVATASEFVVTPPATIEPVIQPSQWIVPQVLMEESAQAEADGEADADAETEVATDAEADVATEGEAEAETGADADAEVEGEAETESAPLTAASDPKLIFSRRRHVKSAASLAKPVVGLAPADHPIASQFIDLEAASNNGQWSTKSDTLETVQGVAQGYHNPKTESASWAVWGEAPQ